MTWQEYFIEMTKLVSSKSKDPSTKVGAVIVGPDNEVLSTGYNDFPRGVEDQIDARRERPIKYEFTEHAERNAIYNAARNGITLRGSTLYLNWEPWPCPDCARAIIQSGITKVVGPNIPFPGSTETMDWQERFKTTMTMFKEAGITVETIEINS